MVYVVETDHWLENDASPANELCLAHDFETNHASLPPFGLASDLAPATRYGPCLSLTAVETARTGGLHVPSAPLVSGRGRGAANAVPLRLRINDTDVSRFSVECIFGNVCDRMVGNLKN